MTTRIAVALHFININNSHFMKKNTIQFFQAQFKAIPVEDSKGIKKDDVQGTIIKGYASTPTLDRYDDVVEPEAFRKSIMQEYRKNPIILFQHNPERPIGKATFMNIDSGGLYIEAIIVDAEIEPKIKAGILQAFSIGYIPKQIEFRDANGNKLDPESFDVWKPGVKRIIKEVDLVENSIVSVPANPDALFTMEKSVKSFFNNMKGGKLPNESNLTPENMTVKNAAQVKENLLDEKSVKAEGDACTMEDGSDGEMMKDDNGELVCKPMKAATAEKKEGEEEGTAAAEGTEGEAKPTETQTENVDKPVETTGEAPKEGETQTDETSGEGNEGEKSLKADTKGGNVTESEEEKAIKLLCTPENFKAMAKEIAELRTANADLQAKLAKTPEKEALMFNEQFAGQKPSDKKESEGESKNVGEQKKGFKQAFMRSAE